MNKIFISVLNAHFKNCLYNNIFINKLIELTNNEYPIIEVYNDNNLVKVDVNGTCTIVLTLAQSGYIKYIDVVEKHNLQ